MKNHTNLGFEFKGKIFEQYGWTKVGDFRLYGQQGLYVIYV